MNKVETRVELRWDITRSRALDERRRRRLLEAFGSRLVAGSVLAVRSGAQRSQAANRRAALERLAGLVESALRPRKRRRATAPTAASREKRLQAKHRHSERKTSRGRPRLEE